MANMSYCRFEGTYEDFKQCLYAVRNHEQLSETEALYASNLCELAREYINAYEGNQSDDEEDIDFSDAPKVAEDFHDPMDDYAAEYFVDKAELARRGGRYLL